MKPGPADAEHAHILRQGPRDPAVIFGFIAAKKAEPSIALIALLGEDLVLAPQPAQLLALARGQTFSVTGVAT